MKKKYLYIYTIGCQMNVYDSDRIANLLKKLDYVKTETLEQADTIIINTCAVREKAEQKAFSLIGRLQRLKKKKPELIIGVAGCVAQQEGEKILKRAPCVDLIIGTRAINRLPDMISQLETKDSIVDIDMAEQRFSSFGPESKKKVTSFVTIMQGCDNFCSYCVVPHVRGREISRASIDIIKEIKLLAASGVKEVTLLGQNVNSYGKKEGLCSFADLLAMINNIENIYRIRFTTSHPKDLSKELIQSFLNLEKLCAHIHLPVQSGSDKILKQMNRKYTVSHYIEKIEKLREVNPDIALSSDFIVGFPGETESDFNQTLELIKRVNYDTLFAFKYSNRPYTRASLMQNKVSEHEKGQRLQKLLAIQKAITKKKHLQAKGSIVSVLAEGFSKKSDKDSIEWTGRTSGNTIVNFTTDLGKSCEDLLGKIVKVKIDKGFYNSLGGKLVKGEY